MSYLDERKAKLMQAFQEELDSYAESRGPEYAAWTKRNVQLMNRKKTADNLASAFVRMMFLSLILSAICFVVAWTPGALRCLMVAGAFFVAVCICGIVVITTQSKIAKNVSKKP